jgi:hypothetical protein
MSSTTNKNDVLIINVWPEPTADARTLWPDSKPLSDEREEDVWDRLRSLTTNPNVRRNVLVMTCSNDYEADKTEVLTEFKRASFNFERIQFLTPYKRTEKQWRPEKPRCDFKETQDPEDGYGIWEFTHTESVEAGYYKEITTNTPCTLASSIDAQQIVNLYRSGKHSALLIWHPKTYEDHGLDGDDLRCLSFLKEQGVRMPVYVFHDYVHPEKWGVEIDGDANRANRKSESGASLWDTQSEMTDDKELQPVIEHVANEGESTWIFGYAKHGKTWIWLCVVKALLTGEPLFNVPDLKVPRKSKRVIYLCPEAGRTSLRKRLKVLGLMEHLYDPITNPEGRLYLRSLSKGAKLKLDDPKLFELAKGADIFIDTAVRYLEGDENSSGDVKVLTENILNLLGTAGARSMWVAHHSGKSFASATEITLENCARGSSEFAAALTNAIGVVQMDKDTNQVHFHFIDGRDMDEPVKDMHLLGRPYLSQIGNFQVTENVERFKGRNTVKGRPTDPEKQAKIDFAKSIDGSLQVKADAVIEKFGGKCSKSTISEWLKEFDQDKEVTA